MKLSELIEEALLDYVHEWYSDIILSTITARLHECVKPLEWEGDGHWHSGDNEGWMEEANTPFGWGYSIEFDRSGNFMADSTFDWSQDGFETPEDAKAAAQAHYAAQIIAGLDL